MTPRALCLALPVAMIHFAGGTAFADFRRGDTNQDGRVDISDAVSLVRALFQAGEVIPCEDAADTNDDGKLAIDDALATLLHLFGEGRIPGPGPLEAGPDPSCDRLGCASSPDATPAIVLSEIQYNPQGGALALEYIELYNRTAEDLGLGGYRFTNGVTFDFSPETILPAHGYLLLLHDPENARWRRFTVPKVGPYEGNLADGGERLTLTNGACDVETVRYRDRAPWPAGCDGTGASLERIDYLNPADDFHSWRASTSKTGTPGDANSTAGVPARPLIESSTFDPETPASTDAVKVSITLDVPHAAVAKATLHVETAAQALSAATSVEMAAGEGGPDWALFTATLPPQASQTLVRMCLEVDLADGRKTFLPHAGEQRASLAYFVYDREMPARLPVLWLFPKRKTGLPIVPSRQISAMVILEPDEDALPATPHEPLVFEGADVRNSRQGQKLKFLKGEEYRDDRTLNMVPEEGGGGTGILAPHMEHMGFRTFRESGAIAPRADWYRVVDYASTVKRHTQRLLIQQISERFLEMNGLDPAGDLYKYVYQGLEKRTNPETGYRLFYELLAKLRSSNPEVRSPAVHDLLDTRSVGLYSVVSVLISNWDGFHNNLYIYNDLSPTGKWMAIPWDLDQVFETGCSQMPITRPLTGEGCNSREPGVLSRPYHLEPDLDAAYRDDLRARISAGGSFALETMTAEMDSIEALLLDDLQLQETYLGAARAARRSQIQSAYLAMRTYLQRRIPYLRGVLGN